MPTGTRKNRLAELRKAQGLTHEQLAEQIASRYQGKVRRGGEYVSKRTVIRWETNSIPERHWAELADIFKVSVGHLLALDDGPDDGGERQAA